MLILIQKDSATKVPKEVADLEEAQGFASNGFHVTVQQDDGLYQDLSELTAPETEEEAAPVVKKPAAKKKR
ncbi:MAG: hypothetical protein EON54_25885 [Alcaligenaceae bacterium]|nr:MAG: hypothetical protein EON54_25885 [Alcaligenaceae bacterium]